MEGLELTAFQIISSVGTARSCYIEAIQAAKKGDYEEAEKLIKEGDEAFIEGHDAHAGLLQKEASGEGTTVNLLILHAEDQLMSAEAFKTIANAASTLDGGAASMPTSASRRSRKKPESGREVSSCHFQRDFYGAAPSLPISSKAAGKMAARASALPMS